MKKRQILKNAKGMTLVEIMIVLAILGGLLAFLGQNVFKQFASSKVKETKIRMAEVGKALDLYYADCGSYPSGEAGLGALMEQPADCSNWGPEAYLKKMIKDGWDRDFIYEPDGSGYVLRSLGADRREGGTGADKDLSSADD